AQSRDSLIIDAGYPQFAFLDIHPQIRLLLAYMDNKDADNRLIFLTPAGAAIAFISFFLPWIQISCLGKSSYSGMDFGGIYWIVLLMSLAIFGAFFLLRKLKRLALLKLVTIAATIIASGVIIYGCITIAGGKRVLFFRLGPDSVHLKIHMGGYGTLLGYLLAILGVTWRHLKGVSRALPMKYVSRTRKQVS
ncbi:MAG: hypothetical protein NT028_02015, partial [candidate division Zixibacteria bacterium]|nr:hypothetical protein [candidate division Zixibacteria bacterium]